MAGTRKGGLRAASTNKKRYGEDFYNGIGRLGGLKSTGGGFFKDRELAREAGRLGGKAGRRTKNKPKLDDFELSYEEIDAKYDAL